MNHVIAVSHAIFVMVVKALVTTVIVVMVDVISVIVVISVM